MLKGIQVSLLIGPVVPIPVSQEVLESALQEFPGTIVLVSHDRELVDDLVDRLVLLESGVARIHVGNYSHYRWKHQEEGRPKAEELRQDEVLQIRRNAQEKRLKDKEKAKDLRRQRKQLEELEENIASVEQLLADFDARFAALDPSDYQQAAALKREYDDLKADLTTMYREWEELAEQMAN